MTPRFLILLLIVCVTFGPAAFAQNTEVNVASPKWGTEVTASSLALDVWSPSNAVDGKWSNFNDMWCSATEMGASHWLVLKFTEPLRIHKVIIRHAGVFADGRKYNTADFRLQRADSMDGLWVDLVPPVTGNEQNVTTHTFAAVPIHFLRLFITKGESSSNFTARIYEIEAYADLGSLPQRFRTASGSEKSNAPGKPALVVSPTAKYRRSGGRVEELVYVQFPGRLPQATTKLELRVGNLAVVHLGAWDGKGKMACWLPVPDKTSRVDITLSSGSLPSHHEIAGTSIELSRLPYFATGIVDVIPAAHNDIAELYTDDGTFAQRAQVQIGPALDLMKVNKDYRFSMECTLYLMDYLRRHPEKKEEMRERIKEGRFEWGGTFNEPIEQLFAGESLVRQVYFGRKWLKKTFPGCDTHIAMNADPPQYALQMSQILHKAGIKDLMLWRGFNEGFFNMASPDGSKVSVFDFGEFWNRPGWIKAEGQYMYNTAVKETDNYFTGIGNDMSLNLKSWGREYEEKGLPPEFPLVDWFDYQAPVVYDHVMKARNEVAKELAVAAQGKETIYPSLRYSTFTELMDRVAQAKPKINTYTGSRPIPWYYDQGPGHHLAITAGREAVVLLTAAEKFATIDALLSGDFQSYPAQALSDAWEAQIYTDHGWGGDRELAASLRDLSSL